VLLVNTITLIHRNVKHVQKELTLRNQVYWDAQPVHEEQPHYQVEPQMLHNANVSGVVFLLI